MSQLKRGAIADYNGKTPISYYGGKQLMLEYILPVMEVEHTVYTELFFGGGAVFFAKKPSPIETINDINGNVVNFYECLKLNYKKLKPLIEATLVSRDQWRRATDIYKNPKDHNKILRAWAFWFCTNYSFATKPTGGLRYSNYHYFSIPKLLKRKKNDFNEYLLARIENATIENKDALVVLKARNVEDSLHYLDPPYPDSDQGHYSGYTMESFTALLTECTKLKGKFILSSYHYPVLTEFCKEHGWIQQEFEKPVYVNSIYRGEGRRKEVLTMNYTPPVKSQTSLQFSEEAGEEPPPILHGSDHSL